MESLKEPTKWATTIGETADYNKIPETADASTGALSLSALFPPITQLPLSAGGVAPSRADFNGALKLLGDNIQFLQHGGNYSWDSSITYAKGSTVLYNGSIYQSLIDDNTAEPADTASWSKITTASDIASLYADQSLSNINSTAVANIWKLVTNYGTSEQILAMHNNVYRGDNLLNGHFSSISNLIATIAKGDFSDIYVGDYFPATYTVDGTSITSNFRIAGVNWFSAAANTWGAGGKPHVVIVPDSTITSYMNSTNTTAGGYVGSYMYTTVLPKLYTALAGSSGTPFYGHIISKYERLTNAISTDKSVNGYSGWLGAATGVADYANQTLTLMSEVEMYGHNTWSSTAWDEEHSCSQLPLFRLNPNAITVNGTTITWLRCVTHSARFCLSGSALRAGCDYASCVLAVRPRFLIG